MIVELRSLIFQREFSVCPESPNLANSTATPPQFANPPIGLPQANPAIDIPPIGAHTPSETITRFNLSPLVRITLLSLYVALTVPLPFLATATAAPVPANWLWGGIAIGFGVIYGALSEQVLLDDQRIQVTYPQWVPWRRGWQLAWADITALKPRSTGQGGLVYYFLSKSGEGYLLPMRVAGFARLVDRVQAQTGIDTQDVKPLAQPWMYLILLVFTVLLLLMDLWTITTAISLNA
jgi:hypothetical protein